jgi:hypothetical protein
LGRTGPWFILCLGSFCALGRSELGSFCALGRFVLWFVLKLDRFMPRSFRDGSFVLSLGRFKLGSFRGGSFCKCIKKSLHTLSMEKLRKLKHTRVLIELGYPARSRFSY